MVCERDRDKRKRLFFGKIFCRVHALGITNTHALVRAYNGCEEGTVKIHVYFGTVLAMCVIVCAENNRNPAACALAVALNIGCKLFWFFSLHTPSLVVNSHLQLHTLMSMNMHEHICIRDYSFCLHTHTHMTLLLLLLLMSSAC